MLLKLKKCACLALKWPHKEESIFQVNDKTLYGTADLCMCSD